MTKLAQIVAVEKGVKTDAQKTVTEAYKQIQSARSRFEGIAREYRPKLEDGDTLPPEQTRVQLTAEGLLGDVKDALTRMWDVVATKDATNTQATADIVVDDEVLAPAVPVTTLLWLEKQLVDLHTLVEKLPLLDPGKTWNFDPNVAAYASEPTESVKTRKVLRNHVKAEATVEHPAQVETFAEDEIIGYWKSIHFSGAVPAQRQAELLRRVGALQAAVKFAREEANSIPVTDKKIAGPMLDYLLAE